MHRSVPAAVSLPEVHRSVDVDARSSWWKRMLAFFGPAYLISVGYMDPGNWATDIEGGSRFGYALIWVLLMSNLMAVLLQTLSARLGIASGRDLAQSCRDHYSRPVTVALWLLAEVAIAACDLAEVLGTAIGLNLLFHMPLLIGIVITAIDSIFLLAIQNLGVRKFEAFILGLVFTVGLCFLYELLLADPSWSGIASGFVPSLPGDALYVAIGIIGATVMPHNLYLHSALVQTRSFAPTEEGKARAARYNLLDTGIALNAAFFVNAAILILAAAVFWKNNLVVTELQQAHELLSPMLGNSFAAIAFALALLAAGQSSTLTGTLAGQIVMEGFLNFKMRPFLRRLITRLLAIIPAVAVLLYAGDHGTYSLLILSQVILSLQLPFAIIPLIHFTADRGLMGSLQSPRVITALAWLTAVVIVALNFQLAYTSIEEWINAASSPFLLAMIIVPVVLLMAALLFVVTLQPFARRKGSRAQSSWEAVLAGVSEVTNAEQRPMYRRIAVALAHDDGDTRVLRHAIGLCRSHQAQIVLVHVVEGAVGSVFGKDTFNTESRDDEEYIIKLELALRDKGLDCVALLGYGSPPREIVRLVEECKADALVMGGHGHRGLKDLIFGATISPVRHALSIPVLIVR